ncbi:sorting nexin-30-like isoform X2 [Acanthaster planci]|uniref:Sorting nexin-30-like isoform X2 n=1 Tax=Acanthaster planci TaxID=133434 RepID=A0A8B8A243_ACAPL|nr:sorting nexin-30-like isoform X2 [Acanthaster planci]
MADETDKSDLRGTEKDPLQNPLSSGTDDEEDIIAVIRAPAPGASPEAPPTANAGSMKLEEEPDIKDLFITVDDFQKHVFTIDTYITYRVFTRTTRSAFDEPEYSVRRRYQDFLWLRQKLVETEETHIIPPLPEKHSMRLDRLSKEFAITRQAALHKFMQRISEHPVISFNEYLKVFLTAKELTSHRKASAGIVSRIGSSIKTTTSALMLKNRSPEFTIMSEYINTFGDKMSSVDRISQRILKEQMDLGTEYESYGPTYRLWANSEAELDDTLGSLSDCLDKCAKAVKDMTVSTETNFLPAIKEYMLYADAVKGTLRKRDFIQMEYELACEELTRRKNEREQVKISDQNYSLGAIMGKDPKDVKDAKSTKLESQIDKLQKQVDFLSDRTEVANADMKADMERWHRNKRKDIKAMFVGLAEGQMESYKQCLDAWERVIGVLKSEKRYSDEVGNSLFQTSEPSIHPVGDGDSEQNSREEEVKE